MKSAKAKMKSCRILLTPEWTWNLSPLDLANHTRTSAMKMPDPKRKWYREEMFHLLSVSGNLSGFCVTGVALFHTLGKNSISGTVADDILAFSALAFLICIGTIFIGLRRNTNIAVYAAEQLADILFTLGLAGMVAAGFVMVYTVW